MAPTDCGRAVSGSLSLPCPGCFSPFLHSTGTLSVIQEYLALPDGAGGFPQGFTGPAVLRNRTSLRDLPVRDCHPLRWSFPARLRSIARWIMSVLQPRHRRNGAGLGSSPFARHYLGNSYWSLLLGVLRCFSSPGSPSLRSDWPKASRVAPFGHPRITGRLRLPADFRSLPRPSSPLDAQASTHAPLFTFSSVRRSLTFVFASFPLPLRQTTLLDCLVARAGA